MPGGKRSRRLCVKSGFQASSSFKHPCLRELLLCLLSTAPSEVPSFKIKVDADVWQTFQEKHKAEDFMCMCKSMHMPRVMEGLTLVFDVLLPLGMLPDPFIIVVILEDVYIVNQCQKDLGLG